MERLIHYVWKYRLFPKSGIFTAKGEPVEVVDPGILNRGSGPDFLHAKVKIGAVTWVGHVGVHNRASDWDTHGYPIQDSYDSIILHVVGEEDKIITRSTGEVIPQLQVSVPSYVRKNYDLLKHSPHTPSCHPLVGTVSKLKVHSWMTALMSERFEQKTEAIHQRLEKANQDWETAFFVTLARNFAFGTNSELFEQWAQSIPLTILGKHRDDLLQIEALFFGQSGLLKKEIHDEYYIRLQKEYQYLAHKFSLSGGNVMNAMVRMRPHNDPHVRIAQLARLYHQKPALFSQLMDAKELEQIFHLLETRVDGYWATHLTFGREAAVSERKMTLFSLRLIVINTLIPFLYAYGNFCGNELLKDKATRFLEELPPEENHIIRSWRSAGLQVENAGDTQALIQLTREYCQKRKCLFCRFGYEFLTRQEEMGKVVDE